MKVMIVDDERRLCAAWERLIEAQPDMTAAPSQFHADGLAGAVIEHKPDVVLLDLTMPGEDPVAALAEAAQARPQTRIVIYSGRSEPEELQRAVDAGAWGVLDKGAEPRDVLSALRRVAQGEFVGTRLVSGP